MNESQANHFNNPTGTSAMNIKHRKLLNAALGLAAGIVTLPFAILAWPILAAWFFFNETDDD